jgi:uncharacterized protein YbjQ (UPF0145 family)
MQCKRCGRKATGIPALLSVGLVDTDYTCDPCQKDIQRKDRVREETQRNNEELLRQRAKELLRKRAESVMITTTHNIDGWKVEKYLGIESVECVIGTGMFSEITTDVQDFLGMRSTAFEKKLQSAKASTFEAIKVLAAQKGGNAIIGIDIDYTEFSGNRIGLIVNGTVVLLVQETSSD